MIKNSLVHLTRYNVWANAKMIEFIKDAGEEKADRVQNSSFPSVRKTMYHIWDAETIWINRLMGKSFSYWPSRDFNGTLSEACDLFIKNSVNFVEYTEEKTETEFNSPVIYKSMEGKEFSNIISQIIMHCMNHSTYHRGQIITMLRNADFIKLSSTDYITFCRL